YVTHTPLAANGTLFNSDLNPRSKRNPLNQAPRSRMRIQLVGRQLRVRGPMIDLAPSYKQLESRRAVVLVEVSHRYVVSAGLAAKIKARTAFAFALARNCLGSRCRLPRIDLLHCVSFKCHSFGLYATREVTRS